jgi:hypothetical protein
MKFLSEDPEDLRIIAYLALSCVPKKRDLMLIQYLKLLNREALHRV